MSWFRIFGRRHREGAPNVQLKRRRSLVRMAVEQLRGCGWDEVEVRPSSPPSPAEEETTS